MLFSPLKGPGTVAISVPVRLEGGPVGDSGKEETHAGDMSFLGRHGVMGLGAKDISSSRRWASSHREKLGWRGGGDRLKKDSGENSPTGLGSLCLMLISRASAIIICCLFQTRSIGFHGNFS